MVVAGKNAPTSDSSDSSDQKLDMRLKIDKSGLYDLMQVKRLLDDELIALMEDEGYEEATLASNIKIVCGTVAVAAALYSHFNRYTYPENRTLIAICVVLYGACAGIIQLAALFLEGPSFFAGVLPPRARRTARRGVEPRVWARSALGERGSSAYVVGLSAGARTAPRAEMRYGYEKYFTTSGRFLRDVFRSDLRQALSDFATKKSQ